MSMSTLLINPPATAGGTDLVERDLMVGHCTSALRASTRSL
jgi:hypothetical protein